MTHFAHPWWEPFRGQGRTPRCLDEWLIIDLSNAIREKDWESKYKDWGIVEKWRNEAKLDSEFSDEIFNYAIRELQWYESLQANKGLKIGPDDSIVLVDGIESLKFTKLANEYESSIPKDYHPGSDCVVDIVHPSLYPLVYGKTLDLAGNPILLDEKALDLKKGVSDYGKSKKFQWLPSIMETLGNHFSFTSYINNLHPKHKDLYGEIERVFNAAIPALNLCLSRFQSPEYVRIPIPTFTDVYDERYQQHLDRVLKLYDENEEEAEEAEEEFEKCKANYLKKFPPVYVEDPPTIPYDLLAQKRIKVIVKMASIELTPEKPAYPGGTWHVEGTINEDIVATVLHYYDVENISELRLEFRVSFEDPAYEQNDATYCERIFGLKDEDAMVRFLGSVEAKQGRTVVFPNQFQHHVAGFELKDKTRAGHRKILCFFLVDPGNEHVVATDAVAPHWDSPAFTKEEALKYREELMAERSLGDVEDYELPFSRKFSLCEH